MAVREFRDPNGRVWRAWEFKPDSPSQGRRVARHSGDHPPLGWVVFQTLDGNEKRRLHPYPADWGQLSDRALGSLLATAVPVPASRLPQSRPGAAARPRISDASPRGHATGAVPWEDSEEGHAERTVRSFRYPGGRLWSVYVAPRPSGGGPPVLRFTAGARVVDLHPWPPDWPGYSDDGLTSLLRRATRHPGKAPASDSPRRRHDDLPL
jgi:hypothetical protein